MRSLVVLSLLVVVACAPGESPDAGPVLDAGDGYLRDDELRVNQLMMKATHNSYHVAQSPPPLPELAYTFATLDVQLREQGVRAFELDVHYVNARFEVFHTYGEPGYPNDVLSNCPALVDCFAQLREFHDEKPDHHPIFVLLEAKDDYDAEKFEDHIAELDADIEATLGAENVFTPAMFLGDHIDAMTRVDEEGWPTLGEARGKFFLMVHNGDPTGSAYAFEVASPIAEKSRFTPFLTIGGPGLGWQFHGDGVELGWMVRARVDTDLVPDADAVQQGLASGFHFLTTDFPVDDGRGYAVELEGGTPSLCNPVTAPADCSPEHLERP